jgi:hypothetical protein
MFREAYSAVMNPDINPLRDLPKVVRFQLMTSLALMWSVVFSVWAGMITWVGPSMLVHSLLLIGVFFTADVFRRVRRNEPYDHRAQFRDPKDGCARYDDIWGG